ncbi:MAG: helix-turn-helix domain-containing protein [Anaerohalosphaeraceae bacterium]|nr:helix-turn-helix domain-containing protein [Anaerohalosphaeraceae bacterium]
MPQFNEKDVIQRIIELRSRYAGSRGKSAFATAIGISPSTYSYYEKDRLPPIPILLKICQVVGADINWLLMGAESENNADGGCIDGKIAEKIAKLANANPSAMASLEAFIELLEEKTAIENDGEKAVSQSENAEKLDKNSDFGLIPILGRTAAGTLGMWSETSLKDSKNMETQLESLIRKHLDTPIINSFETKVSQDLNTARLIETLSGQQVSLVQKSGIDDEIVQFLDCEALQRNFSGCFGLQIDGDSMAPRINDGDIIVLNASVGAVEGQIAVVCVRDAIGVTCKIIRIRGENTHLIPINERYETKIVPSESIVWAMAVLCHMKINS